MVNSRTVLHSRGGDADYVMRVVADSIDAGIAVERLQQAFGGESMICLDGAKGWCLGIGMVASLIVRPDGGVEINAPSQQGRRVLDDQAFSQIPELLDQLGYDDYRAYGWVTFEATGLRGRRTSTLPAHGQSPVIQLIIPRIELRADPHQVVVRALDEQNLQAAITAVTDPGEPGSTAQSCRDDDGPTAALMRDLVRCGGQAHRARVRAALEMIRAGRVEKVVVTRRVELPFRVDPVATFRAARRSMSGSRAFLIMSGRLDAVGVTPEVVLRVDAQHNAVAELVAGTRPVTGDRDRDKASGDELQASAKEQFEHAVCLAATEDVMGQVTSPGSIRSDHRSDLGRYGQVQHLGSRLRGRLAQGVSAWDALGRLFPPLTLTGVPQLAAAKLIAELEDSPRGPFGGVVVTSDADGSLEAAAMLRAVFQDTDGAWLQAGGGIVPGSDIDQEFDESTAKMTEIATHLAVARTPTDTGRR